MPDINIIKPYLIKLSYNTLKTNKQTLYAQSYYNLEFELLSWCVIKLGQKTGQTHSKAQVKGNFFPFPEIPVVAAITQTICKLYNSCHD